MTEVAVVAAAEQEEASTGLSLMISLTFARIG